MTDDGHLYAAAAVFLALCRPCRRIFQAIENPQRPTQTSRAEGARRRQNYETMERPSGGAESTYIDIGMIPRKDDDPAHIYGNLGFEDKETTRQETRQETLWSRFNNYSSTNDLPRSGRPRITTPFQDWYIRVHHLRNRHALPTRF
ncbi:uncharacterized protein LOC124262394 [Haliotis rubra]|uniref:uncharacterized protein LOC124262394 n=1 Tax=Haliotis rubra TaxID=36100 RepID=UPI001EE6369D|nr:uncharacterized protein LOC124262394 [Haliotis rubra]